MEVESFHGLATSNDEDEDIVEGFDVVDGDSCKAKELSNMFSNSYVEIKKHKGEDDKELSALLASNSEENFAIVLCDKSVNLIDKETFQTKSTFRPHKKDVTDILFSPANHNLVYTSSLDGKIKMWDSRSNSYARIVNFNSKAGKKPLTTFDVSPQERIICAGTELIGEDSYLLFWDLNGNKLLGGYWEVHSDEIARVKFNPHQANSLASSGVDGLLNVFDISKNSEEDALTYCLNAEDTVNAINWYCDGNKQKVLAITNVQSIQLWDIEESAATMKFSRENITKSLKRKMTYECYVVPTNYTTLSKNPIILAGSGLEHSNSCLRTLKINEKNSSLEPHGILKITDGSTSVVQASSYSEKEDSFLTVSENGMLSIWKNNSTELLKTSQKIKQHSYLKNKTKWPY